MMRDNNNRDNLWLGLSTNSSNDNLCNINIIYDFNIYMVVWGRIYYSNILNIYPFIRTPINQWLKMFAIVGGHV